MYHFVKEIIEFGVVLGIMVLIHELGHFAATTAIGSGAGVRTVAGRLGHADASVTLRV